MTLKVQVFSDYVCPFCFLAEGPLNEAVKRVGDAVEVEWMPFELRPYPMPTLKPEGDYLKTNWRDSGYPMAERLGVPIILPRVSPQPYTRLAFEGALEARAQGKVDVYNHRMFTAFFQDELDIGNADVLSGCAKEIGLDEKKFRAALNNRSHSYTCEEQLQIGRDVLEINSVPTFVIDNRISLPGIVTTDVLVSLFREHSTQLSE